MDDLTKLDTIAIQLLRAEEELEQSVYTMTALRKSAVGDVSMRQLIYAIWRSPFPRVFIRLIHHIFPNKKRKLFVLIGPATFDDPLYLMRVILKRLGAEIHTVPDPNRLYDLVLGWHNSSQKRTPGNTARPFAVKLSLSAMVRKTSARHYWNCSPGIDISKRRLEDKFKTVFGRNLGINPETHTGPALEKSNENAAHDGRVVQCPLSPVAGKTYQYYVDRPEEPIMQWRIIVMDGKPVAAIERIMVTKDCSSPSLKGYIIPIAKAISRKEHSQISELCREVFVECCDLDMLRDTTGKMWIVDINPTAVPIDPRCIPAEADKKQFIDKVTVILQNVLCS